MVIPKPEKAILGPDDCEACRGAGGFVKQTGCMGEFGVEECEHCNGKGELTQEQKEKYGRRLSTDALLAELRQASAKVTREALALGRQYSDEQYRALQEAVRAYDELDEQGKKLVAEGPIW